MRIPEKPPDWRLHLRKISPETMDFIASPMGRKALSRINDEYLHWEKAKHVKLPQDIKPEQIWAVAKSHRYHHSRLLPMKYLSGEAFTYWLPDAAQEQLHYLDRHTSGVISSEAPEILPGVGSRYLVSSLMEEAIASSQIEGAATTRKVAKQMLRSGRTPRTRNEQMILNNFRTVRIIKDYIDQDLSVDLLNEFHRSMTKGTLENPQSEGRIRRPGVKEDEIHVVDEKNQVLHIPTPADQLPQRLESLCSFANTDFQAGDFIHPIVKAIILHFWLAYEHPYVDGNGRTARAVFYWYALKSGYWLIEYLSISRIMLKSRDQYLRSFLYAEGDDLDSTYFLTYHLKALRLASDGLRSYLNRKQKQFREAVNLLPGWPTLDHRQLALLKHALAHPDGSYTFKSHGTSHGIAYPTARNDLLGLSQMGLLVKRKIGRQFVFFVPTDLNERLDTDRIVP
ncbi:MAG TPA: Fic family protein [Proteobacteria bacterium]|nr:Fic family protein [Pseudomonadota bacterium]